MSAPKGAPITLYLDGNSQTVHPIDAPAWRENGWGDDPETVSAPPKVTKPRP